MMNDPIVCALISSIPVIANTALDETLREAIRHAYDNLKERIKMKFGGNHDATTLINEIEKQFDNDEVKSKIIEKIAALNLGNDPEIRDAAHKVSEAKSINSKSVVNSHVMNFYNKAYGSFGEGASATFNIGSASDLKKA